jgi:hypothetical protein
MYRGFLILNIIYYIIVCKISLFIYDNVINYLYIFNKIAGSIDYLWNLFLKFK